MEMKPISLIQPSRNTLKYLKWSYTSIRKNLGYIHEICMADDASTDGTWEWMKEIADKDINVKIYRNEGPERLGHTLLYDTLINEVATNDIVMIFHSDMYACPGMDEEVLKHLKPGTVVSATRIEPPLHPDGPEKILMDFGIETEEFKEQELLTWLSSSPEYTHSKMGKETTEGIFAPWAIYKDDFQSIGGHDPLYAPQSKEDSCIFNRMSLAGYKFIQTWKGFCYHMTCRGSRFKDGAKRNPGGQVFMKNRESDEWLKQNMRSTRNFIRKFGSMVKHDEMLKPIVQNKYNIGIIIENCTEKIVEMLEPWFATLYVDCEYNSYIENEQQDTLYILSERVQPYGNEKNNDILVKFDANNLTELFFNEFLLKLPLILDDSGQIGKFQYEIFDVTVNSLKTYQNDLLKIENNIENKRVF